MKALAACSSCCWPVPRPGARSAQPRHLRVLFVGNSLTATNDLPATVARSHAPSGTRRSTCRWSRPVATRSRITGRTGLRCRRCARGRFDVVVLQQGPSSLPESRVNLIEWAKRWADEARAHGTRPAVLTVWPERERFSVFADVVRNYRDAARGANALLLPAGQAWRNAFRRRPAIGLYGPGRVPPEPPRHVPRASSRTPALRASCRARCPTAGGVEPTGRTALVLRAATAELWR